MTVAPLLEKRRSTLAEFEQIPVGPPYYEFDEGETIELATPKFTHQKILAEFTTELTLYRRKHRSGEYFECVDVYLPDGKVYVPDFGFLSNANLVLLWDTDEKIHGAPDMVAEITSQDANRDRVRKFHVYHANGVQWYWIVDQATLTIEEYRWTATGYTLHITTERGQVFRPELFPGMELNLAENLGAS